MLAAAATNRTSSTGRSWPKGTAAGVIATRSFVVCKSQWMACLDDLAIESHMPVRIDCLVGKYLQTAVNMVNLDGQQVWTWPGKQFNLMPRAENNLLRHHLQVNADLVACFVTE